MASRTKIDIANLPVGSLEEAQKYVQDRVAPQDRARFLGAETPGEVAAAAADFRTSCRSPANPPPTGGFFGLRPGLPAAASSEIHPRPSPQPPHFRE